MYQNRVRAHTMSSNATKDSRVSSKAVVVVSLTVIGLASCGGGGGGSSDASSGGTGDGISTDPPSAVLNLSASASPAVITYGAASTTSVITWSSANSATCSSSPSGISGAWGTFTTPALTKTTTYTITCTGTAGSESKKVAIVLAPAAVVAAIAAQQGSCAAAPVRGTPYYYCDCGTGAAANCVPGDDSNAGTDPAAPRRTLANADSRYAGLTGTNTIAFCKGGAFNAVSYLHAANTSCPAGSTCTDFREYASPVFASSAKPILNSAPGSGSLFWPRAGMRILNLRLQGNGAGGDEAIFLYGGAHDITACNLDIDGFRLGVNQNTGSDTVSQNRNITLTGNNFTNNVAAAYLGGGPTTEISKNYMINNGSGNLLDHTVYVSSQHLDVLNMTVKGNYMYGQIGDTCSGVMLVGHGKLIGLQILDNVLEVDEAADAPGCYGISLDSGGYLSQTNFSNTVISGNTVINAGFIGIAASSCADCLIEDNAISFNARTAYGISVGSHASRPEYADIINDRNTIRNNTIWFGPNTTSGAIGIQIRNEGTGHIIANNTVTYTSTNAGNGVNCFDYTQPIASYTFIDNNHCYSAASTYAWDKTYGALAAWRSASSFDSVSLDGMPAGFVNSATRPYDFHPAAGSPLRGAGSHARAPVTDLAGAAFLNPPAIGAYE
jgi:parallel beta-helix repeat protein